MHADPQAPRSAPTSPTFFRLQGFFVDTNRDEHETSLTFEGPDLDSDGVEIQHEGINQRTYTLTADGVIPLGAGQLGLAAGWSGYRENTDVRIDEGDTVAEAELDSTETLNIKDDEYSGTVYYAIGEDKLRFKAGVDLLSKTRNGANLAFDDEGEPDDLLGGAVFRVREKRYDPYARLTFKPSAQFSIDAGLRYEITRRTVSSNLAGETALTQSAKYETETLNPSLHLRYDATGVDQFRASLAHRVAARLRSDHAVRKRGIARRR